MGTPGTCEGAGKCAFRVDAPNPGSQSQAPAASPPADPGDTCEQGFQPGLCSVTPRASVPRRAAEVAVRAAKGPGGGDHTTLGSPGRPGPQRHRRISVSGETPAHAHRAHQRARTGGGRRAQKPPRPGVREADPAREVGVELSQSRPFPQAPPTPWTWFYPWAMNWWMQSLLRVRGRRA